MSDTSQQADLPGGTAPSHFRSRMTPDGSLTERIKKIATDLENCEKQFKALRTAFEELRSNI